MKPNFICMGFPKCGTTSLQEILRCHPDIFLPDVKEAGYFIDSTEYRRGMEWYEKRYYSNVGNQKIIGEINGGLAGGFYARNLHKDLGDDLKIVFIMRNPVIRLYSHFNYKERIGFRLLRSENSKMTESLKFDQFLKENMKYSKRYKKWNIVDFRERYLFEQGKYSEYIKEYLDYFKPENLHFIIFEEYIKNPKEAYRDLFHFLGVEMVDEIDYDKKANEGKRQPRNEISMLMNEMCTEMWRSHLRNGSFLASETDRLVLKLRDFLWDLFTKPVKGKSVLGERAEAMLQDYYREDKNKLAAITGKDLDTLWYR